MPENASIFYIVGAVAGVGVLLMIILLPLSFSGLEYYEYGFKKQKSTGTVNTEKVFSGGKHFIGPDFEFKKFKASSHFLDLIDVTVFTADKLEIKLDVHFQYFLKKDDLATLHRNYDLNYETVIKTSAIDALKGEAPQFSTRDYITSRNRTEAALFRAVRERLSGNCCDKDCTLYEYACPSNCKLNCINGTDKGLWVYAKYFQLGAVEVPSDVQDRYLRALILTEEAEREKLLQEAQVERKTTEAEVKNIQNSALEISQDAQAQSQHIKTIAAANYTATIEKSRAQGLKYLYEKLGLTTQEMKNSFDYLHSLRNLDNVHLTVDFQQRIVGSFTGA